VLNVARLGKRRAEMILEITKSNGQREEKVRWRNGFRIWAGEPDTFFAWTGVRRTPRIVASFPDAETRGHSMSAAGSPVQPKNVSGVSSQMPKTSSPFHFFFALVPFDFVISRNHLARRFPSRATFRHALHRGVLALRADYASAHPDACADLCISSV